MALLDLNGIKALYAKGVDYAKREYKSILFSRNDDLFDLQLALVNKAQTLQQVMNAIWMGNPTWASAFWTPSPICAGCELSKTGIQFGYGHTGWYFLYGICGDIGFNLSFFRLEIAPPDVVNITRSEAVRWMVLGGYGKNGSAVWNTILPEWIYMNYTQPSYSTFTLTGTGQTIQASITTIQPMEFNINVSFIDDTGGTHSMSLKMLANTPPLPNTQGACMCASGLGSMYYSYTDMNVDATIDGQNLAGKGWIDHQNLKTGIAKGLYVQSLQTVMNVLSKNVSGGWLWFSIQDFESGKQYMLTHFFEKKFFADEISIGSPIDMQVVNVYDKGVVKFNPTEPGLDSRLLNVAMTSTIQANGYNLPMSYNITLPDNKKVILKIATAPNIFPVAVGSYETPAYLTDLSGNIIGIGLIEANAYMSNTDLATRLLAQGGGNPQDPSQLQLVLDSIQKPQTTWQKVLGFIIALIPIWIIILVLWIVFRKKDQRKERFFVSVIALLFLAYILS